MRTTIRLDDSLLAQAKSFAVTQHRTLTSVIEESLREYFARQRSSSKKKRVSLPTFSGSKLMAGVDLDDSASLLELMESRDSL